MPLPKPGKDEEQQDFVSRCAGDKNMNKEYPDQKQRVAVCYSLWRQAKKQKKAKGSEEPPIWGEDDSNPFHLWH